MSVEMEHQDHYAGLKVALAWFGTFFGALTLQHWVLTATLIYTLLQIYLLVRDKVLRKKGEQWTSTERSSD